MSAIFPQLPVTLGTYRLTRLLGSHEDKDLYIAEQSHVDRLVLLEVMRPSRDADKQQRFLDDARARVSTSLPHVAQVLESTQTKGYWHITHELPKGRNLATLIAEGGSLSPEQACRLIRNIAELYNACKSAGYVAENLSTDSIFVSRSGKPTFLSPITGTAAEESDDASGQMQAIVESILPALTEKGPGRTRLITLLTWMRDGFEGQSLDWAAIASTASQIIEQLESATLKVAPPPTYDSSQVARKGRKAQKNRRRRIIIATIVLACVLGMGAAGILFGPDKDAYRSPLEEGFVYCDINGEAMSLHARPVSIGEYRKFLEALNSMSSPKIARINSGLPPEACQHEPDDWSNIISAATHKTEWNGRKLSLSSPITNVSYWDALSYARYAGGYLPRAAALQAALALPELPDSGIEEWTESESKAFGPYSAGYLVLPPGGGSPRPAASQEERHPNRGFRLIIHR